MSEEREWPWSEFPDKRSVWECCLKEYDALKAENEKLKNRFSRQAKKYWEGDLDSTLSGIKALKAENGRLSERYRLIELANKEWTRNDAVTFGKLLEENRLMRECLEFVESWEQDMKVKGTVCHCLAKLSKKAD